MSRKITDLTQLTGAPADSDVILITDVSEDASKQITVADFLSSTSEVGSFVFDSANISTTNNVDMTISPDVTFGGGLTISSLLSTGTGPFNLSSASSINFTATDAVTANGIPLPSVGGRLEIGDSPVWYGSAGVTVSKQNDYVWRVAFSSAFTSTDDYSIMATLNFPGVCDWYVEDKQTGYFELNVRQSGSGNALTSGEFAITIYEF